MSRFTDEPPAELPSWANGVCECCGEPAWLDPRDLQVCGGCDERPPRLVMDFRCPDEVAMEER